MTPSLVLDDSGFEGRNQGLCLHAACMSTCDGGVGGSKKPAVERLRSVVSLRCHDYDFCVPVGVLRRPAISTFISTSTT